MFKHASIKFQYLKQSEYFFLIICYLKLMIKHFKEKFIKNTLIYKFYRYLKYKINFFPSYGATGEDVLLNKIFKKNWFLCWWERYIN